MASDEKWYFTKEQLENTPSRQCSIDGQKELFYRQQAANFIQDMGQRLKVSQLCINTASVYMHRFYVFHSFTHFPWSSIAAAALFLSAKVEEQPRKLEHVIRVHNICKNPREAAFDINSEKYQSQCQDLVFNENVLLQTLGFDVAIDHPHAHVVRCCHLVRASKDLAQSSYFMASTSLHLTTFCLQYKPTVVACFCIHLACKWSNWEIPLSKEKKEWFSYVDPTVTSELLQQLTEEFLVIFGRCPSRLKEKILSNGDGASRGGNSSSAIDPEMKKLQQQAASEVKDYHKIRYENNLAIDDAQKNRHRSLDPSNPLHQQQREREYREKKEQRERMSHQHKIPPMQSSSSKFPPTGSSGHPRSVDPKLKAHRSTAFVKQSPVAKADHKEGFPHRESGENKDPYNMYNSAKDTDKTHNAKLGNESLLHMEQLTFNTDRKADVHRVRSNESKMQGVPKQEVPRRLLDDSSKTKLDLETRKQMSTNPPHHSWMDKNKSMYNKPSAASTDKPPIPKSIKNEYSLDGSGCNNGSHPPSSFFDERKPFVKKPSVFSPEKTPPRKLDAMMKHQADMRAQPHSLLGFPSSEVQKDKHSPKVLTNNESLKPSDTVDQFRIGDFRVKMEAAKEEPATTNNNFSYLQQQYHSVEGTSNSSVNLLGQPIVNGIETNPTLISNLLKEAPSVPHLTSIAGSLTSQESTAAGEDPKDKLHKDRKKKSKEKHKHKDKPKDEKEKKRKHKDKDKEKQRSKNRGKEEFPEQPIKITISKDKIQTSESTSSSAHNLSSMGLKIKIPKDKIKTDIIPESSQAPGIKIKISKDVISNISDSSKKREHDRSLNDAPPSKLAKSGNSRYLMSDKSNGRNPLPKVGPSTSDNFKNAQ